MTNHLHFGFLKELRKQRQYDSEEDVFDKPHCYDYNR